VLLSYFFSPCFLLGLRLINCGQCLFSPTNGKSNSNTHRLDLLLGAYRLPNMRCIIDMLLTRSARLNARDPSSALLEVGSEDFLGHSRNFLSYIGGISSGDDGVSCELCRRCPVVSG
jgi:hypothetical protein